MPVQPSDKQSSAAVRVLLAGLFLAAFLTELLYVINPINSILQSLKFAGLSYPQRQQLQEGELVKTVDDLLEKEYAATKGTCFIELPYDKLAGEGFGSKDPLLGPWGYLLYRTNYNLYPRHVDWGYRKNDRIFRIFYDWKIIPESTPVTAPESYPCIIRITAQDNTVTITKMKGNIHAP